MEHIGCSNDIIDIVSANLWPAYEDLFDKAEEHVLIMLLSQWNELCWKDTSRFHKVTYTPLYVCTCVYVGVCVWRYFTVLGSLF